MNTNKRESTSRGTSSIGVDSRPFADKGVEALAGRNYKIWPACIFSTPLWCERGVWDRSGLGTQASRLHILHPPVV